MKKFSLRNIKMLFASCINFSFLVLYAKYLKKAAEKSKIIGNIFVMNFLCVLRIKKVIIEKLRSNKGF